MIGFRNVSHSEVGVPKGDALIERNHGRRGSGGTKTLPSNSGGLRAERPTLQRGIGRGRRATAAHYNGAVRIGFVATRESSAAAPNLE